MSGNRRHARSCSIRSPIADTDGVYDAGHFNDRLLLGLKGTMSEAELHLLKARMHDGCRAKARRGEPGAGSVGIGATASAIWILKVRLCGAPGESSMRCPACRSTAVRDADSEGRRPVVPTEGGHRFQSMSATL
jgi:hypothetical protein